MTKALSNDSASMKFGSDPKNVDLRLSTWKGLSKLGQEGLVRNLGVSNFGIEHMQQIQALKLAPIAANQMQYHPWAPTWMKEIAAFCRRHRIVVTGYFSLGGLDQKEKAMDVATVGEIAKAHE